MPIAKLLQEANFEPEDVDRLRVAFGSCLVKLGLKDRSDPMTQLIARQIIDLAREGIRDPDELCAAAMKRLGK